MIITIFQIRKNCIIDFTLIKHVKKLFQLLIIFGTVTKCQILNLIVPRRKCLQFFKIKRAAKIKFTGYIRFIQRLPFCNVFSAYSDLTTRILNVEIWKHTICYSNFCHGIHKFI